MTEMEMNHDVETEEFTDELSDEALDREGVRSACVTTFSIGRGYVMRPRMLPPVADR